MCDINLQIWIYWPNHPEITPNHGSMGENMVPSCALDVQVQAYLSLFLAAHGEEIAASKAQSPSGGSFSFWVLAWGKLMETMGKWNEIET